MGRARVVGSLDRDWRDGIDLVDLLNLTVFASDCSAALMIACLQM